MLELVLLAGWSYRLDALSLLFASSCAGAAVLGLAGFGQSSRGPAMRYLGALLFLAGLLQTALAGETWGRWAGLELANAGLLLAGVPGGLPRHLAGYPLLLAALSGILEAQVERGLTPPTLPPWVVLAVAVTSLWRAAAWPFGLWARRGGHSPADVVTTAKPAEGEESPPGSRGSWTGGPADPTPGPSPAGRGEPALAGRRREQLANTDLALGLYGIAALYVLLRTLDAGPWDGWARAALFLAGMMTLLAAALLALARTGEDVFAAAWKFAPAIILIGFGVGTPASVAGATVMLIAAPPGLFLISPDRGPGIRLIGGATLLGLPPAVGFAAVWLLAASGFLAGYPLAVVAVPLAALAIGAALANQLSAVPGTSRFDPVGVAVAAIVLAGGLAAEPLVNLLLRPALSELAAGLPALREVQAVAGLGLAAGGAQTTVAIWPASALAVCLGVTLVLASFGRQVWRSLGSAGDSRQQLRDTAERPALVPGLAAWPERIELPRPGTRRRA